MTPTRVSRDFPRGAKLQFRNSKPSTKSIGNGLVAIPVAEKVDGDYGYLVCTPEFVSMGELLTLAEVEEKHRMSIL